MRLPEWHLTTAKARAAATVSKECVFPRRLGIAVASKLSVPTADSLDMAYIHDQRRQDARASEASHRSFWLIRKEIAADAHAEARLACWRLCSGVCGKLFHSLIPGGLCVNIGGLRDSRAPHEAHKVTHSPTGKAPEQKD